MQLFWFFDSFQGEPTDLQHPLEELASAGHLGHQGALSGMVSEGAPAG